MRFSQFTSLRVLVLGAAFTLGACSYGDNLLWPADEEPQTQAQPANQQTAEGDGQVQVIGGGQPPIGATQFVPPGVTPGEPTGTFVGEKVVQLREELTRLQNSIAQQNEELQRLRTELVKNSQQYHGTIAAVNSRLQVGTTPGNPILVQQFKSAQADLDRIAQDIDNMNNLTSAVASNSTLSAYMAEAARAAFSVSGAVDEDHRQLAILEDEGNRTAVLIDRLLKELTSDVRRQTNYVTTERANLNLISAGIKSGELFGGSLVNRAVLSNSGQANFTNLPQSTVGRTPLVVIRFDRADVPYEQALYTAVSKTLERRPNAMFDLVAVAPTTGGTARIALNSQKARQHAENVMRSLVEMGLPPNRVAVSARTEQQVANNEVHLYVR
ncbi:MAG: hypothetical protein JJ900_13965 [Rhodospirillales bacterium]|nr:hypothetical protein [Rhodospirillales bacterium]MBO6787950.1 hypothetical protein [Rhodospirillales bacterium]